MLFNKHLLCIFSGPGTILDPEDIAVNRIAKNRALPLLTFEWKRHNKSKVRTSSRGCGHGILVMVLGK